MRRKPLPLSHTDTDTHTYILMIMDNPDKMYPNNNMYGSSFRLPHETGFEVSDFFEFNDWIEEVPAFSPASPPDYNPQNQSYSPNEMIGVRISISSNNNSFREGTINRSGSGREKKDIREKVAFKTKSEVEVLDDGFKWRKYGKKMVKNSPNPRNYYKCSVEGCSVKKRVERDKEDPNYVVTTYEGIHTHQGPHL